MEENPAVIYLIEGRLPRTVPDLTDLTSRYFLGVRLNCAQCHDHPFVKWKQQDFWGMAAFFTQIQTPGKPKLVYQVGVKDDPELTLDVAEGRGTPDGFLSRPPTFLGGEELAGRQGDDEPRRAGRVDDVAEEPLLRPGDGEPDVVAAVRPRARQPGGRHARGQPAVAPGIARPARPAVRRVRAST